MAVKAAVKIPAGVREFREYARHTNANVAGIAM